MFDYKITESDSTMLHAIKTFCDEYVISYRDIGIDQKSNGAFNIAPLLLYDHIKTLFIGFKYLQNKKEDIRFLDVGCGTGNIIAMAKSFGANITAGIEINTELKTYTKKSMIDKIYYEDALKFNKYKDFNYIYFLRPFVKDSDMHKLLEKIITESDTGTIILSIRYIDRTMVDKHGLKQINTRPPIIYEL